MEWNGAREWNEVGQAAGYVRAVRLPFDAKCRQQLSPVFSWHAGRSACGVMFSAIKWACHFVLRLLFLLLSPALSLSWLSDCSSVDLYLIAAANNVCKHCNRLGHSLPLGHHLWGLAGRFDVVPMPTLLAPCGERPVAFIVTNWASWGLLHQGAVYSSRQRGIMSSPLAQLINVLLAVRRHYYVHKYL